MTFCLVVFCVTPARYRKQPSFTGYSAAVSVMLVSLGERTSKRSHIWEINSRIVQTEKSLGARLLANSVCCQSHSWAKLQVVSWLTSTRWVGWKMSLITGRIIGKILARNTKFGDQTVRKLVEVCRTQCAGWYWMLVDNGLEYQLLITQSYWATSIFGGRTTCWNVSMIRVCWWSYDRLLRKSEFSCSGLRKNHESTSRSYQTIWSWSSSRHDYKRHHSIAHDGNLLQLTILISRAI